MHQTFPQTGGVSLREVLPQARIIGAPDIRVTSCCSDAKRCRPGDVFVALVTDGADGHDDAWRAIHHGATSILAERLLPVDVPICVVEDTREAFGQVCQHLMARPADRMHMVGVTGTAGKTVASVLIRAVLEAGGHRVGMTSTLGYFDGRDAAPALRTTPPPPQMAQWLARMLANGCTNAVLELSSKALAQRQVAGLNFDAAVLTNVYREHLDFHGSIANYRKAKARLFRQLHPQGFAVVNADDPASRLLSADLDRAVLTVGIQSRADLTANVLERRRSEQIFLLVAGDESVPVRTRMIGDHHVYNCLAAAAVGLLMNIDLATVARGLESIDCVPGRLERLECGQPFGVFVDYARTPQALATSLRTLRQVTPRRLICLFGADAARDRDLRPLLGRVVERGADVRIITNDNPRHEPPLQIVHDILDGFDRPARAHVMPDRERAIHWALGRAAPGDTVLIAGKGNEDHQIIGHTCYPWDDRDIARRWLYEVGTKTDYNVLDNHILRFVRHSA